MFLLANRGLERHPRFCEEYERVWTSEALTLFVRIESRPKLKDPGLRVEPACAPPPRARTRRGSALAARSLVLPLVVPRD